MIITLKPLETIFTECVWGIRKKYSRENINMNSSKPILLPACITFALEIQSLSLSKGLFLRQIDTETV